MRIIDNIEELWYNYNIKRGEKNMTEYKVVSAEWIEVAEGYGYWEYEFEEIKEND